MKKTMPRASQGIKGLRRGARDWEEEKESSGMKEGDNTKSESGVRRMEGKMD